MGQRHDHADASRTDDPALDPSISDDELSPGDLSRRGFLRGAGVLGAGAAATTVQGGGATGGPVAAHDRDDEPPGGYRWLAGDHHIHTQYSGDGVYRVVDHARHAHAYGLDWIVITDHGGVEHAKIGVEKVHPDIVATREGIRDLLVFQGLEWNIPAAEHGTVFVHPGRSEVAVLKEFEKAFDGSLNNAVAPAPQNEALAIAGINFLADAVAKRRVPDALFLANHPARRGFDSPHEIRGWRDAQPHIAVGFEGAPGHQALGLPAPHGAGSGRGGYDFAPGPDSFPGFPLESYRTWGGFDWMTATVGGLWDSLLAEGRPWWISANSDTHFVYLDTVARGPGSDFPTNGFHNDPVSGAATLTGAGDFWPGYYSRTHVGATAFAYGAVMDGIRAGRIWVDHGGLISGLDVQARVAGARHRGTPLGGVLQVRRGTPVELTIDITLANAPNWAQFVPTLARVDVIAGDVTGPAADRDTFSTPATKVVRSFEVGKRTGRVTLTHSLGQVDKPFYLRVREPTATAPDPGPSAPQWTRLDRCWTSSATQTRGPISGSTRTRSGSCPHRDRPAFTGLATFPTPDLFGSRPPIHRISVLHRAIQPPSTARMCPLT